VPIETNQLISAKCRLITIYSTLYFLHDKQTADTFIGGQFNICHAAKRELDTVLVSSVQPLRVQRPSQEKEKLSSDVYPSEAEI
jgi:hypothetical protein